MKKYVLVTALALATVGCTGPRNMTPAMATWVGTHIDEVISRQGYPSAERVVAGHRVYIWSNNRTFYNTTAYGQASYATIPIQSSCDVILEVNEGGWVVRASWQGNDCGIHSRRWKRG